jgi:DNA-binding MarR family transcriptional regulator
MMDMGTEGTPQGDRSVNESQEGLLLGRRVLSALRRVIRAVDIYSRQLVSEYQITGPQLVCLNAVLEKGPVTATDLAHDVQLSASTVVRILDRLEQKQLIRRDRQLNDRRRVHVTVTAMGRELSLKAPYSAKHPLRRALQRLPREDQETVTRLLETIVGAMDAEDLSAAPIVEIGGVPLSQPGAPDATSPRAGEKTDYPAFPN